MRYCPRPNLRLSRSPNGVQATASTAAGINATHPTPALNVTVVYRSSTGTVQIIDTDGHFG